MNPSIEERKENIEKPKEKITFIREIKYRIELFKKKLSFAYVCFYFTFILFIYPVWKILGSGPLNLSRTTSKVIILPLQVGLIFFGNCESLPLT